MALSRTDRLTAVSLGSTAERLCSEPLDELGDGMGRHLADDLDAGSGPYLDKALTILAAISTDRQLLAHAAARFTAAAYQHPVGHDALRLLVAAGADLNEAQRIQAARGGGWSTPQAEPWQDQTGR